jgi:hypothetical protein
LPESTDDNLKSRPKQFWKYLFQLKETNTDFIDVKINGAVLNNPRDMSGFFSRTIVVLSWNLPFYQLIYENIILSFWFRLRCSESYSMAAAN